MRPTLKGRPTSSSKSKERYVVASEDKSKGEVMKIRFNRVGQKKREEEL
jgi:hypothetical protein